LGGKPDGEGDWRWEGMTSNSTFKYGCNNVRLFLPMRGINQREKLKAYRDKRNILKAIRRKEVVEAEGLQNRDVKKGHKAKGRQT